MVSIWGEATSLASDSKKFGAWDQNLMTEWHIRYRGPGIMVYWHVEKKALCIYSQIKRCSSSEVAAMIEGVLRHCTDMEVEKDYVDSHGQDETAFAFCYMLDFELLPRLKGIGRQKLYRPETGNPKAYPNLQPILTRPINWELIGKYYDEDIKYTTALKLGTADAEAIFVNYKKEFYKAIYYSHNKIVFNGKEYPSPSAACKAVTKNPTCNGWTFWSFKDKNGKEQKIDKLR